MSDVIHFTACPGDQIPTDCMCVQTCETKALTGFACPLTCYPGCQCAPGFVESGNGDCIPDTECPCYDVVTDTWNQVGYIGSTRVHLY